MPYEAGSAATPTPMRGGRLLAFVAIAGAFLAALSGAVAYAAWVSDNRAPTGDPVLLVIGDSYSEGVDNTVVWPQLFAEAGGYQLLNLSVGGTGYVSRGFATTFEERIPEADVENPRILIFAGSRNDLVYPADEIRAAAERSFRIAEERFPDARVVAVGPIWDSSDPPDAVQAANRAVAAAADRRGVEFIDALAGNFLGDPTLIHPDGIHATDAGQQVLSDRIASWIGTVP